MIDDWSRPQSQDTVHSSLIDRIPLFLPHSSERFHIMSRYRRNAEANRDALFGPNPGAGSVKKKAAPAQPTLSSTPSSAQPTPVAPTSGSPNRRQITGNRRTNHAANQLQGDAKVEKMKEAEEYRAKAKKALQRTLFSSPDPIAGAMFYHRAAEAYKLCGENRLERLHRIASADCQMGHNAYTTAAQEYTRAAELSEISEEKDARKRAECTKLYADAAKAWREGGEMGRASECMLKSGFSLLIGEDDDMVGGKRLAKMSSDAMKAIETAVESFVPDPLNRYNHFRQTGESAFVDPNEESKDITEEILEVCRSHMVKSSFAHETLSGAVQRFVEFGEYKSGLYAAGAVSAILESDGFSTISLSRAYCIETILTLAVGDVVAADRFFLDFHLQNNIYLSSRECKLAEDLIRAIKMRDVDDLEKARDPNGENRAALNSLDYALRSAVANLKISGAAKKSQVSSKPAASSASNPPSAPTSVQETVPAPSKADDGDALQDEMDDLMNDMGLGSDDEDDDDDDDLDLR